MKIKTTVLVLAVTTAATALTGCGGAPGNAEVREGLRNRAIAFLEQIDGKKPSEKALKEIDVDLDKVKVVACQKATPMNGFNCDWTGGEAFTMIAGGSHRFLKTDSGWILATPGQ